MTADYTVAIDWNADGDFTDPREDVTARVLDQRHPITIRYGRDEARAFASVAVGEAHFMLNNISRDYSPENPSSPLAGSVLPARVVLMQAALGGATSTVFTGTTDNFELQLALEDRSVQVDCLDPLGQLKGLTLDTELFQGLRTGDAINALLDAASWPAALRDIDEGATVMPFWWLDGDDAFQALQDILDSEGPPSLITVDSSRRLVFRDRHHRLQRAASLTSQSTWRSSGAEPTISAPSTYNNGFREIVNTISFEVPQRRLDGVFSVVWSAPGLTNVAIGETLEIVARSSAPFEAALVPIQDQDYTLLSGSPTITLSRDSGASTTISITAGGTAVSLLDLQVRAFALVTSGSRLVKQTDWGSVYKYGARSLPDTVAPKWPSYGDARAIAVLHMAYRAERQPTLSVTMRADAGTARLNQILNRDLSDRVHITEEHSGLDADCFIEQIQHEIGGGGTEHTATFGLEKALSQISGAFILGTSVLGTGKLGRRGIAEPSTMFVLGTSLLGTGILSP